MDSNTNKCQQKLLNGIREARQMIDLFLNNRLVEARLQLETEREKDIYGALAHSTCLFIEAISTVEEQHLKSASETLRKNLIICNQRRRRGGIYDMIKNQINSQKILMYKQYPEESAHAELCYAEGLLQFAFISMLQDDKLSGLINSSLKIRQCYKCYKRCWRILKHRQWDNEESFLAFESGVRLGVGAFNLMISMLPKRVLKLMEFVGFSGDRNLGLEQLRLGEQLRGSLRAPLCALLLLVYNLYAAHMFGDSVTNIQIERPGCTEEIRQLLAYWRCVYPESAIFLLLAGRAEACFANLDEAIHFLDSSIECKTDWVQYKHVCYWELMWCHALKGDWLKAVKNIELLEAESRWSPVSYRYIRAIFLLEYINQRKASGAIEQQNGSETGLPSDEELYKSIDELLKDLSDMTNRFVGRSLPLEKIAIKRSKGYFANNRRMVLPVLEILYMWNAFKMVKPDSEELMNMLVSCESTINYLFSTKDSNSNFSSDYCLALLLKGVCLRCRGQTFQASMCFQEVLSLKKELKSSPFLLPFSEMELCQISYEGEDFATARKHLNRAMSYKGYSLEARLQFRLHAMETELNQIDQEIQEQDRLDQSTSSQDVNAAPGPSNSINSSRSSRKNLVIVDGRRVLGFDDEGDADSDDSSIAQEVFRNLKS